VCPLTLPESEMLVLATYIIAADCSMEEREQIFFFLGKKLVYFLFFFKLHRIILRFGIS